MGRHRLLDMTATTEPLPVDAGSATEQPPVMSLVDDDDDDDAGLPTEPRPDADDARQRSIIGSIVALALLIVTVAAGIVVEQHPDVLPDVRWTIDKHYWSPGTGR